MDETGKDLSPKSPDSTVVVPKYQILHERGVTLTDDEIDFVVNHLTEGMQDAKHFLNRDSDNNLGFMSSDDGSGIGYVSSQRAINIPLPYLNMLAMRARPLDQYVVQTGVITREGDFTAKMKLKDYLKAAGREEVVHHYQTVGHEELKVKPPNLEIYKSLTLIDELLCDFEVEARRTVDQISVSKGEIPVWENRDNMLAEAFPQRYNRSAEALRPDPFSRLKSDLNS